MNCKEFNIWLYSASETEILTASSETFEHTVSCSKCERNYKDVRKALEFMNSQKQLNFSDTKTHELIEKLADQGRNYQQKNRAFYHLNRIAVTIIIIVGLLTGILAGGLMPKTTQTENNTWSGEFTLLSENTDIDSYVFD